MRRENRNASADARELADGRLRGSEERYRSVTQTSVDAIVTTDRRGRIETWNRGAEHMFGYLHEEVLGRDVTLIIPPKYREAHNKGIRRYLETGRTSHIGRTVELEGLRKNGSTFPIELSLSTWQSEGEPHFGGIIRDISERKRMEQLRDDVQRMVRHDLKSPLMGIANFARLLARSPNLDEKEREWARTIQDLGRRTLSFIDNSSQIYKMEEGTYQLNPCPVHLPEVLRRVQDELAALLESRDVEVVFRDGDGALPEGGDQWEVPGEEHLLEIMFTNLVKNAAEASPKGGRVAVTLHAGADALAVDIHNAGEIPWSIRDKFFEPYATYGKKYGTGLGTHSAQLIANTHGGVITFTSSAEAGTHVTVRLPRRHDAPCEPPERP
jgi:PAS domain S-box-containing protein